MRPDCVSFGKDVTRASCACCVIQRGGSAAIPQTLRAHVCAPLLTGRTHWSPSSCPIGLSKGETSLDLLKAGRCPRSQIFKKQLKEEQSREGWGPTSSPGTEMGSRVKEIRTLTTGLGRGPVLKGGKAEAPVYAGRMYPCPGERKRKKKTSVLLFGDGLYPSLPWSFVTFDYHPPPAPYPAGNSPLQILVGGRQPLVVGSQASPFPASLQPNVKS